MEHTMFGEAKIKAVGDLMRDDERVVIIGGAGFGGLLHSQYVKPLFEEFDSRILRTPIAELGFCGMGVGAAIAGLYPIVTIGTGSFAFEAWPQICNEAPNITYMSGGQVKVPVMFQALVGIRISGAAQHSARPQAMLMQVAGLQVIAPARAADVGPLLKAARDSERPTFWIDHALLFEETDLYPPAKTPPALGKAEIVRAGKDVTIVGYSIDLVRCLKAAVELEKEGIDAEVIDLRTLTPLDWETVCESVGRTGRLVVADECYPAASVASEIASIFADKGFGLLKKPAKRLNFPAVPVPLSPPLEIHLLPTVSKIVQAAKELVA
ncbi:MAG: transketolase C-terminal domain-containing protein [Beijerinckiaceae bacterium]|nr:transketolase C-terminal domain-containing protein [Beijerinckiaceae bacterium]